MFFKARQDQNKANGRQAGYFDLTRAYTSATKKGAEAPS